MRDLLFAAIAAAAMMVGGNVAAAMSLHADAAAQIKPLLVQSQGQDQCPAGYHWQAAGYTTNGKYRDAGCVRD